MSSRRPPRESVYYRVSHPPLPVLLLPLLLLLPPAGCCSSFSSSTSIAASSPPSSLKSSNKSRPARPPGASSTVELGTSGGPPRRPAEETPWKELAWMSRGYRTSERRGERERIELAGRSEEFAAEGRASSKETLDCDVGAERATSGALAGGSEEGANAAGDFVARRRASKWYSPRAKRAPCCWQRFFF